MARFEGGTSAQTFTVGGPIAQYVFVKVNMQGTIEVAGAGEDAIGVTLEGITSEEYDSGAGRTAVAVRMLQGGGLCGVRAAANTAIAVGAQVASTATGEATTAAAGNHRLGFALEAAADNASQELLTVLLDKMGAALPGA